MGAGEVEEELGDAELVALALEDEVVVRVEELAHKEEIAEIDLLLGGDEEGGMEGEKRG